MSTRHNRFVHFLLVVALVFNVQVTGLHSLQHIPLSIDSSVSKLTEAYGVHFSLHTLSKHSHADHAHTEHLTADYAPAEEDVEAHTCHACLTLSKLFTIQSGYQSVGIAPRLEHRFLSLPSSHLTRPEAARVPIRGPPLVS